MDVAVITVSTDNPGVIPTQDNISVIGVQRTETVSVDASPVCVIVPQGIAGDNGQGVPPGGGAGDILVKQSNSDYDTAWQNIGISFAAFFDSLPIYETDDEANADLNTGDYYWLRPAADVGQNKTFKQVG